MMTMTEVPELIGGCLTLPEDVKAEVASFAVFNSNGIRIRFLNGYEVSIIWGWGTWCDNDSYKMMKVFSQRRDIDLEDLLSESVTTTTFEVGIWSPDGSMIRYYGRERVPLGWCTPDRVISICRRIKNRRHKK